METERTFSQKEIQEACCLKFLQYVAREQGRLLSPRAGGVFLTNADNEEGSGCCIDDPIISYCPFCGESI